MQASDRCPEKGRWLYPVHRLRVSPNGSLLNAIAMMEAAELYGKY
jgi:hypothetical protein